MAEPVKPQSSDEMIAELPNFVAGIANNSQAKPIGVPANMRDPVTGATVPFTAQRVTGRSYGVRTASPNTPTTSESIQNVAPEFFEGDEYGPSTWMREDIGRLQLALRSAGLVSSGQTFRLGVWDDTSRGAYRKLLEYANGAGYRDPMEALRNYASEQVEGDDEERAPLTTKVTNADDLRRAAQSFIPSVIGRRLDDSQLNRLIAAYQQLEASEQEQEYGMAETGGRVQQAPSFETYAENEAKKIDPQGAAEMTAIDTGNEFFQLLTSNGLGA